MRVDDTQLNLAITRIAQQNNFPSLAEFRAKLEADGVDYKKFREEIRSEIISTRLREREVESKLVISDGEVDNYLANKARIGSAGEEFHLAHILVVVPEQASAEKIQAARERAEQALSKLKSGADFAQVAAGSSDAKDALKGGDLGWRSGDRIPPLFMNELQNMKPGQIYRGVAQPERFSYSQAGGKAQRQCAGGDYANPCAAYSDQDQRDHVRKPKPKSASWKSSSASKPVRISPSRPNDIHRMAARNRAVIWTGFPRGRPCRNLKRR